MIVPVFETKQAYIEWAASQVSLQEDEKGLFLSVPSSKGGKDYRVEIESRPGYSWAADCNCPDHIIRRLSCKHMAAGDLYLESLQPEAEGAA